MWLSFKCFLFVLLACLWLFWSIDGDDDNCFLWFGLYALVWFCLVVVDYEFAYLCAFHLWGYFWWWWFFVLLIMFVCSIVDYFWWLWLIVFSLFLFACLWLLHCLEYLFHFVCMSLIISFCLLLMMRIIFFLFDYLCLSLRVSFLMTFGDDDYLLFVCFWWWWYGVCLLICACL